MLDYKKYCINIREPLTTALTMLNEMASDLTLFVINDDDELVGTITDGDVRRGVLSGKNINDAVSFFMKTAFHFIHKNDYRVSDIIKAKKIGIQMLPVVDDRKRILKLINFSVHKSYLPLDVVIMAGGRGLRLSPLTDDLPKPLLKVGYKPILEHSIDLLKQYGIDTINISINYLGEKIAGYFGDGSTKDVTITYIREKEKSGTLGSLSMVENLQHENILVMNSDLLTNIDLEEFFSEFETRNADMSVACIPYNVNIPYAVMDTDSEYVLGLKEKPTITYQSNAGIYLIRKEFIEKIPPHTFYNATDFIEAMIADKKKITYYPLLGYWLDIGKIDDFMKAQEDIKHIKF